MKMCFVVEYFPKFNYVRMVHPADKIKWTNMSDLTAQRTAYRITDRKQHAFRENILFWLTGQALRESRQKQELFYITN